VWSAPPCAPARNNRALWKKGGPPIWGAPPQGGPTSPEGGPPKGEISPKGAQKRGLKNPSGPKKLFTTPQIYLRGSSPPKGCKNKTHRRRGPHKKIIWAPPFIKGPFPPKNPNLFFGGKTQTAKRE